MTERVSAGSEPPPGTIARTWRRFRRLCSTQTLAAIAERALLVWPWQTRRPQLFVLGLPRSGTTLVYQYIVHRWRVAYFTNGVGDYHAAPCVTTWWQTRRHGEYRSDFVSHYGKVEGPVAPREAGGVWAHYFPVDERVAATDLSASRARHLRRTIACVQRGFGDRPFVNKNVKHLLRIRALAHVFPDAHFLVVTRDEADVAKSLLRARSELSNDESAWWSIRPRCVEELQDLPPALQVAAQVRALNEELTAELARLPTARVHHIRYEEFCADPESCSRLLIRALGPLEPRNPPERHFAARGSHAVTPVPAESAAPADAPATLADQLR